MKKKTSQKLSFKNFLSDLKDNKNRYLAFLFFTFLLLLLPGQNYYQTLALIKREPQVLELPFSVPSPALYPEKIGQEPAPQISSQAALVMDVDSQVVMYAKRENTRLLPASTTKIMTALVALKTWKPEDVLEVPPLATRSASAATDSALMGLSGQEKLTIKSLLYGLLLNSAADSAYTLSINYPGSQSAFIKEMNKEAKNLHLDNTNFTNETGFDDPRQYTTVLDLARLATRFLKNPLLSQMVETRETTVADVSQRHWYGLKNLNKLLWEDLGVMGVKTGFTEQAGECLVALAQRNGRRILTVILKSQDRFTESRKLINWAFNNHKWLTLSPASF